MARIEISIYLYSWLADLSSVVLNISYATFNTIQNHSFHLTTFPQKIIFLTITLISFLLVVPLAEATESS